MAGRYDTEILTGTDFTLGATWLSSAGSPVSLTGWSARMQIRTQPAGALCADMSTGNGQITLGGSAGTVVVSLPASATAGIPAGPARYDLLMTNTTPATSCLLYGAVDVREAITRG